jgi:hypothetical protein
MDAKRVPSLHRRLERALHRSTDDELRMLDDGEPTDTHDELLALACIHDLHLAPLSAVGAAARWQHHPTVAAIKQRAEANLLARFPSEPPSAEPIAGEDARSLVRQIAASNRIPPIYDWAAEDATHEELVEFITLEGGPDDGFDDLVALCQVGLGGTPKMEMARNYWDEMGCGDPAAVHRTLHRDLARALDLPAVPRTQQGVATLRRTALTTTVATNRALQPEMVGVLGMIELQAGPRCRKIVRGLDRLGLPAGARPFYEVHATTDPHHGKYRLDDVIGNLAEDPTFAEGIVRGARWRSEVDGAFFAELYEILVEGVEPQAA